MVSSHYCKMITVQAFTRHIQRWCLGQCPHLVQEFPRRFQDGSELQGQDQPLAIHQPTSLVSQSVTLAVEATLEITHLGLQSGLIVDCRYCRPHVFWARWLPLRFVDRETTIHHLDDASRNSRCQSHGEWQGITTNNGRDVLSL